MNRHVEEHTARHRHIRRTRGLRVAGCNFNNVRLSDLSSLHGIAHGFKIVIKPAVKSNLIFQARTLQSLSHLIDFRHIMVNRLLAENMLTGVNCLDGDRGMRIGRGANQHGSNLRIRKDLMVILRHNLHAQFFGPRGGLLTQEGIGNRFDLRVLHIIADTLRMDLSDSACADNTYLQHSVTLPFFLTVPFFHECMRAPSWRTPAGWPSPDPAPPRRPSSPHSPRLPEHGRSARNRCSRLPAR